MPLLCIEISNFCTESVTYSVIPLVEQLLMPLAGACSGSHIAGAPSTSAIAKEREKKKQEKKLGVEKKKGSWNGIKGLKVPKREVKVFSNNTWECMNKHVLVYYNCF